MAGRKNKRKTPRSQIKSAIRGRIWLRSRERAFALKREGYCCERCGIKQSKAKGKEVSIQVHHKMGIDWDGIVDVIIDRVLQDPDLLEVLCVACHDREHKKENDEIP